MDNRAFGAMVALFVALCIVTLIWCARFMRQETNQERRPNMQMRRNYFTTNKKIRAQQHRKDAQECERAGFPGTAQVNWQMAMLLDPPRYDDTLVEG